MAPLSRRFYLQPQEHMYLYSPVAPPRVAAQLSKAAGKHARGHTKSCWGLLWGGSAVAWPFGQLRCALHL